MSWPNQVIVGLAGEDLAGRAPGPACTGIQERLLKTAISLPQPAESYCGIRRHCYGPDFQCSLRQGVKTQKLVIKNLLEYKDILPLGTRSRKLQTPTANLARGKHWLGMSWIQGYPWIEVWPRFKACPGFRATHGLRYSLDLRHVLDSGIY